VHILLQPLPLHEACAAATVLHFWLPAPQTALHPRCCLHPQQPQDYNKQVVTHLTLPNVQANLAQLPAGATRPSSRYYSGKGESCCCTASVDVPTAQHKLCLMCSRVGSL
jgi:hypothetical protein